MMREKDRRLLEREEISPTENCTQSFLLCLQKMKDTMGNWEFGIYIGALGLKRT